MVLYMVGSKYYSNILALYQYVYLCRFHTLVALTGGVGNVGMLYLGHGHLEVVAEELS